MTSRPRTRIPFRPCLGCDRLVSRAKVIENQVMAFSVISISSDSSEESVGAFTARVILFGTIPTTIPSTAPTYTSPFICTDSSDSDTPDSPPSQDSYEVVVARWRSRVAARSSPPSSPIRQILPAPPDLPRRPAVLVSPRQLIPVGRPYRTQPNGVLQMLTVRKRVRPLPTHRLALRYSVDYSSSDQFTSDTLHQRLHQILVQTLHLILLRDILLQVMPYQIPLVSHLLLLLRGHIARDVGPHQYPYHHLCAELYLPYVQTFHHHLRGLGILIQWLILRLAQRMVMSRMYLERLFRSLVKVSYEPYTEPDVDSDIQADVDACILFADDLRARGTDVRVVVETVAEEGVESNARGTTEVAVDPRVGPVIDDDVRESVRKDVPGHVTTDRAVEVTYETLGDLVQRFHDHVVEIPIHWIQVIESVHRFQGHRIVGVDLNMPTATRIRLTQDVINELIAKRVEGALKAYDAAKNPGTETEMENEQQEDNVGANGDNGNGNANGNGNHNVNNGGVVPVARECTYQDFVKCQPLNFKRTEGVVGLTRWFEKMEMVFHISNCPRRYQVKTVRVDAAYAMTWKALMKLMTEVYCPRNEIQEMETKLWNLTVKGEEDKVEKYIGGLSDNIQGNVIAVEPTRLQDAIRIANNLMDQKLKGYAIKNAENKRRFNNNQKDNRGQQQQPFKRQNVNGQNVAKAYTVRNNVERKGYAGVLPYCNKCRMHHQGSCMEKRANLDSNVVTGTFLLNNCYTSMLFDSGADKSFVSTTFSAMLDVIPSTLDTSYVVELADGWISETNVILRGCTLGLLGHLFDIDLMPVELGSFDIIVGMDLMRSSWDFYTKFYKSLGRAPNRCSSSIGKTRRVVIVHSGNRLGRLDHGLTEF
ncbi:putative reverse transcriptase domain-containing protein [Tanacetum coccineum]